MKTLTRKIEALEKNVLNDTPNPEETYIGTSNKAELELFHATYKILENRAKQLTLLEEHQMINPMVDYTAKRAALTLSEEAEAAVKQAERVMFLRATHIFNMVIAPLFHLENPLCKKIFYTHLFWFLSEVQDMLHHRSLELQIISEPGFCDLSEEEQNKKLKYCYNSRREWFTKDSRLQWIKNH
jgi:hypothetical protein